MVWGLRVVEVSRLGILGFGGGALGLLISGSFRALGFGVQGLGLRVWGLGLRA